jgi:hypothetical protein
MSIKTGVHRLAQAIKWGGRILATATGAVGIYGFAVTRPGEWEPLGFFAAIAVVVLIFSETVAWVLDGFAKE